MWTTSRAITTVALIRWTCKLKLPDEEETSSSSESTSSDSSCSTSSLPDTSDMSDTEEAAAGMARGMVGGPLSDSGWYVSTTDDEIGQRLVVSRPVPKDDGSQGPV